MLFLAGNGKGLELDFDRIVAGRETERQEKRRRKREYLRFLIRGLILYHDQRLQWISRLRSGHRKRSDFDA